MSRAVVLQVAAVASVLSWTAAQCAAVMVTTTDLGPGPIPIQEGPWARGLTGEIGVSPTTGVQGAQMNGTLSDNLFTLELINAFSGGGGPGTLTGGATANIITSFTAEHDGTWSLTIGGSGFFTQANGDMANALARVQLDLAEDGVLIYPSMMGFGQSWSDSGGPTPAPSGINTGTPLVAGSYFGDVVAGKTYALSVTAHATFSLLGSQAFAQADASGIVFGVAYDEGILASTSPPAETPVPEPAFLGLTALAVPLVLRRRR